MKPKMAHKEVIDNFDKIFCHNPTYSLKIHSTSPLENLYKFDGKLVINQSSKNESQTYNLSIDQFLHRGGTIKNSTAVYAMVIYTGIDTKLILNLGKYSMKISTLEVNLNKIMLVNLVIVIVGSAISCAIASGFFYSYIDEYQYIF